METIEPIIDEDIDEGGEVREAIIFVHLKYTWHEPTSEKNKLFLSVHPVVLSVAKENLKKMIFHIYGGLVSICNEKNSKPGLETWNVSRIDSLLFQKKWTN
jgi:hypothetical protein